MSHARGRRRYRHAGVYFPDTSGLRAALIDAGQLTLCLEALLRERGLVNAELVPRRGTRQRPLPAVSVREALEALHSAYGVFYNAAAVVERVDQAIEQVDLMLDAAEATNDDRAVSQWIEVYDLCTRMAADMAPLRREKMVAARTLLRAAERKKARG